MIVLMEVLCISFFIALYATAFAITGDSFNTTLSQMLTESVVIQELYLLFIGMYSIITLWIIFLIYYYDFIFVDTDNHNFLDRHKLTIYYFIIYTYIVCALLKLVGFIGLFFFDVNTKPDAHYAFAAIAFICSTLASFLLFCRRLLIYTHLRDESGRHIHAKHPHQNLYVLILDGLVILTMLGLIISFAVERTGGIEFFLVLFLILDPSFFIYDFNSDPIAVKRYSLVAAPLKTTQIYVLPKKENIYTRLYHKLLFYYNKN